MFSRMPSPLGLRTFESAARLSSFKAAAEELSVTPTAISHQIRALEEHLGVALFTRRTRAVELTESGKRLAMAVHQSFQQIMLALEDIAAAETVLTVSTTPAFAALWLVPRLGRFHDRHPGFRIQLETSTFPIDLERDRRVDLAIRYGTGPYPKLRTETLVHETLGAYATRDYLRSLKRWENAVLIETDWHQPGLESQSWDLLSWNTWLSEAGIPDDAPRKVRRFDQEHYVVQAGLASQGVVLVSSILVRDLVQRGWLEAYRPEIRLVGKQYTALCLPERASLQKIACFLEWLREEAAGEE